MAVKDRGDRGALAVLGMMLLAVVLVTAIATWTGQPADQQVGQPNDERNTNQDGGSVVAPRSWLLTYPSPQDTLAQWIAAVGSLLSVAVSIWAVRLVRGTLEETRRATKAAARAADAATAANANTLRAIEQERENADKCEPMF